ncbi:MAG: FadR family transcriptional regulator [Solirubrobacterales bacterium]|nr:FadR family transcriptional regulator [Solirubrobacterales bacterium]
MLEGNMAAEPGTPSTLKRASEISFAPVATERVSDVIAERLARAIRDGELRPGDRLPTEQELADDFQVGRTSVREGLQKLRAFGLIETRKGLGAFVSQAAPADPLADFARWTAADPRAIVDLVEARFALEGLAAALAAVRATPDQIEVIERHNLEHAEAGKRRDVQAVVDTDEAFHTAIMAAARNRFLERMYHLLIAELTDFRRKTLALPWAAARSATGHGKILKAIRERDAPAAKQAMTDHLFVLYTEIHENAPGDETDYVILSREALL